MKAFSALCQALRSQPEPQQQVQAIATYLQCTAPADAAWAIELLARRRPRAAGLVPLSLLRELACGPAGSSTGETTHIPPWLFDACAAAVGNPAETIAHLVPVASHPAHAAPAAHAVHTEQRTLATWMDERIAPLAGLAAAEQAQRIRDDWAVLEPEARVLYTEQISGSFKPLVHEGVVQKAIAQAFSLDRHRVVWRMQSRSKKGPAPTTAASFDALIKPGPDPESDSAQPFPFHPAQPLQVSDDHLGEPPDWLVEWKWDGVRAQVLRRGSHTAVWGRNGELLNDRVPEIMAWAEQLPDGTVLDGELLVWPTGAPRPAPRASLLARLGRSGRASPSARALREMPVRLMAFDLLELQGQDLRKQSLVQRRAALEALAGSRVLLVSPAQPFAGRSALPAMRALARTRGAAGLLVKRLISNYSEAAKASTADWRVYPMDALSVPAVLLYVQNSASRQSAGRLECSLAVWSQTPGSDEEVQGVLQDIREQRPPRAHGLRLLPVAKTSTGLSEAEWTHVHQTVKKHSVGSFGPVRSLLPSLVVELGFDSISRSARHKSGVVAQSPRMLRLRDDLRLINVGALSDLQTLLAEPHGFTG